MGLLLLRAAGQQGATTCKRPSRPCAPTVATALPIRRRGRQRELLLLLGLLLQVLGGRGLAVQRVQVHAPLNEPPPGDRLGGTNVVILQQHSIPRSPCQSHHTPQGARASHMLQLRELPSKGQGQQGCTRL